MIVVIVYIIHIKIDIIIQKLSGIVIQERIKVKDIAVHVSFQMTN